MACSIMQKTLLGLELEQQAEEVCGSIWGGAAFPDPVNEWVLDWPAFMHGYLTGNLLYVFMSVCTMSNKDETCINTNAVLSN